MSENAEILKEKYSKILEENGIHDKVEEITVIDSGVNGDGMASLTQNVTVTFENQNKAQLHLFVKAHTQNPSHEVMLDAMKAFEKEARFFMEYVPAAQQLCKSAGLQELIDFYPQCYFGDENIIVLENIAFEKGHIMLPHEERHDLFTTIVALKTLAKHHAVSYAMIKQSGGMDGFLQRFPNFDYEGMAHPIMVDMMVDFLENGLKTNIAVVKESKLVGGEKTLAKLNELSGTFRDMFLDALHGNKDTGELIVLNHGDYKSNNMMFLKDKKTNAICHHMLIDFQMICCNDPSLDLTSYLFLSAEHKVRQSRLQELLNVYRETLNKISENLGYPINLSYDDLLVYYRKRIKLGFLWATTVVGPGVALQKMSGMDISKTDVADFAKVVYQYQQKWIIENPEKVKDMAQEIQDLVMEYTMLQL